MRVPTLTGPTSASTTEARATQLADADDIGPRIMKVATGFERWMDVQPEMFVDVSDEELAKYDKFLHEGHERRAGAYIE